MLIGLVVVIWGLLGVKIVGAINPTEKPMETMEMPIPPMTVGTMEKDTFSIVAQYRDPFLGTLPKNQVARPQKPRAIKNAETPQKNIVYSGSVAANGTGKRLYFVSIDGQQHVLSKNGTVGEVRLLAGNQESITVRYGTRTESISLSQ